MLQARLFERTVTCRDHLSLHRQIAIVRRSFDTRRDSVILPNILPVFAVRNFSWEDLPWMLQFEMAAKANKGNVISRFHKTSLEIRNLVGSPSATSWVHLSEKMVDLLSNLPMIVWKWWENKKKYLVEHQHFPMVLPIQMEIAWNCSPKLWDKF